MRYGKCIKRTLSPPFTSFLLLAPRFSLSIIRPSVSLSLGVWIFQFNECYWQKHGKHGQPAVPCSRSSTPAFLLEHWNLRKTLTWPKVCGCPTFPTAAVQEFGQTLVPSDATGTQSWRCQSSLSAHVCQTLDNKLAMTVCSLYWVHVSEETQRLQPFVLILTREHEISL